MAKANQIPTASVPGALGKPGGLADKVENVLQRAALGVLNAAKSVLASVIEVGISAIMDSAEQVLATRMAPTIDAIIATPNLPPWLVQYLNHLKNPTAQGDALSLTSLTSGIGSGAAGAIMAPIFRVINYAVDEQLDTMRPDLSLALAAKWRVPASIPQMDHSLGEIGWAPGYLPWMEEVMRPRLDPLQLIMWARRQGKEPSQVHDEIAKFGYEPGEIDRLIKLSEQLPGPGDLISMAVREAWDESFAALAGTDADLPREFIEAAAQQGLSADWCKRYWRAHWNLPSAQMGFEMLHRGVIERGELDKLLKALDISPGWRDKLVEIAYNVPTRVDLRRAYRDGVIDEAKVRRSYLDIGYNAEWADILTKWTVIAYAPEEKDITIADVRGALERGMMNEAEATDALKALDVSDEAIAFYIAQSNFKRAQALKEVRISAIESKFVSGKIDRAAAASALTALSLPASEIEANLDAWTAAREAKVRQPTFSDLRGFYMDDLIPAEAFKLELKKLGYDEDDIALYLRSTDADKERAAKAESERAQNEQERIEKAERASAYQKYVAATDAEIANQKMAITNAQTALNAGLSDAARRAAEDKIDQLGEQIAAERKTIAEFRAQRTKASNALDAKISAALRANLDTQIGVAQTKIAEIGQQLAALDTQIAGAKLDILSVVGDEEKASLKQSIAEMQLEQAQLREQIEAEQLAITNARNELRLRISDSDRQALEATIRDADEAIKKSEINIADYNAQQATLHAAISAALNTDQRAALSDAINAARKRIAELQVARAQARVEE